MTFFITPVLWFSKTPVITTIHGLDAVFPPKFYQSWLRKYLNKCKAIIAVSDGTAGELSVRGIDEALIHTISNGFDPNTSGTGNANSDSHVLPDISLKGKKLIVSVGRCVQRKGFSWFIEDVLPHLGDNIVYVICGPTLSGYSKIKWMKKLLPHSLFRALVLANGIPLDELRVRQLIAARGLEKKVFHYSSLSNREIHEVLAKADIFVMPNIKVQGDFEGFGLVAFEAIMSGTVCLASNTDGIPSAIQEGFNGYLIAPGDSDAWVRKIRELLSDEYSLDNEAKKFRNYTMNNFNSWEQMAKEYNTVFETIVGANGSEGSPD